jgi:branched-chain amino acid aminotransferase
VINNYCIINDKLISSSEAAVGINDLALQRGFGIFDYFKILNNQPVFLQDHLDRFFRSAATMRLAVPVSRERLIESLEMLIRRNGLPTSGVKLLLTGGYSTDGFNMGDPNLIITQAPLPAYGQNPAGIKIITYRHQRQLPAVKTIDYLMAILLQPNIVAQNAQDVLYYDHDGYITECPRANIFIVSHDGVVLTPAKNILKGIIRSQLLKMRDDYSIGERQITLDDLLQAKEVFITSTTKDILPVFQVDDCIINEGHTGPVTASLAAALKRLIQAG